jgi:hypothetical protein
MSTAAPIAMTTERRDEPVTRNVAKLVQIPTPRYKVGRSSPRPSRPKRRRGDQAALPSPLVRGRPPRRRRPRRTGCYISDVRRPCKIGDHAV